MTEQTKIPPPEAGHIRIWLTPTWWIDVGDEVRDPLHSWLAGNGAEAFTVNTGDNYVTVLRRHIVLVEGRGMPLDRAVNYRRP